MAGLLIAIFFGWLGGYRFYKKQTVLGVVYLLTLGLFGIGWIIDIICAVRELTAKPAPIAFDIEITGGWAECKKRPEIKRKEVLLPLEVGTELQLTNDYYKNAPYFLILAPSGLDLGAVPSEINQLIRREHPNAALKCVLTDKSDPEHAHAKLTIIP